jgi:hypothetical protein
MGLRRAASLRAERRVELFDVFRKVATWRRNKADMRLGLACEAKYLHVEGRPPVLHEEATTTSREDTPHS